MHAMMAVGMDVERSQNAHVSAQAAGAQGHSNHENSQKLARLCVHTPTRTERFEAGQVPADTLLIARI